MPCRLGRLNRPLRGDVYLRAAMVADGIRIHAYDIERCGKLPDVVRLVRYGVDRTVWIYLM